MKKTKNTTLYVNDLDIRYTKKDLEELYPN